MQAALRPAPPPSRMHSARRILLGNLFLDPAAGRLVPPSRPLLAIAVAKRVFSRRFGSSGWGAVDQASRRSEEEQGGPSEAGDPAGEAPRGVWSFYDPLAGNVVTRVVVEDGALEGRLDVADESSKIERAVPRFPVPRTRKPGVDVDKEDGSRVSSSSGSRFSSGSVSQPSWLPPTRRKSRKTKVSWVCVDCGATPGQWWGSCHSCGATNTIREFSESVSISAAGFEATEAETRSWLPQRDAVPRSLTDVNKGMNQLEWRIPLPGHFGMEVARVLGGGLVPGSLVLIGGDPGVGKSTLLLQIAAGLTEGFDSVDPARVIYVSGEESIEQIGNRADRMRISAPELYLYSSTDIEDILEKVRALSPKALVVDSIQTVYLRGVAGSAGNIMQVKECTSVLLRFAKQTNIPVLLIGHVTKTGDIAGPRMLEHIVDVVLYLEGERYSSYRLLRSAKNRFGSTDELGVFEMSECGLQAIMNPSELFLSDDHLRSDVLAGLAVAVIVDGSRTFLIEIQALCVTGSTVTRQVNGIPAGRADIIIAVLMKQAGLKLEDTSICLNVVGGFKLMETAGDLAVAVAICSSFLEFPLPNDVAFIGEIGLGGELRMVSRMDKRISAVAKLGYRKCVIPKSAEKSLVALDLDIKILGCRNLKEVINKVFQID